MERLTEEVRREIFKPLVEQIMYKETGYGKFRVFDYEASLGKTYTFSKTIVENYHSESMDYLFGSTPNPFKERPKVLIVIKTKKESFEVADKINQFDKDIRKEYNISNRTRDYERFAIAVNGDSGVIEGKRFDKYDKGHVKALQRYPAVIITQAMYLQMCRDEQMGQQLFGNRKILIIDEEVDFVYHTFESITGKGISVVEEDYLEFSNQCKSLFKVMVDRIRKALALSDKQLKRVHLNYDEKQLEAGRLELRKLIHSAIDDKTLDKLIRKGSISKQLDDKDAVIREVCNKIDEILQFYNNDNVVSYQNGLYRYEPSITPFTLKNNIWIDASARFNHLYELDEETFIIGEKSERIIDHSNCILYMDNITKSTTSGKEAYVDLERDVLRQIQATIKTDDKVLIIDNKEDCQHINNLIKNNSEFSYLKELNEKPSQENNEIDDEEDREELQVIDTVNYFAMRGKNRWGEYNKCYILQQPQLIFPYYVFLYEYWTKEKLTNEEMFLGNYKDQITGLSTFGFHLKKEMSVEDKKIKIEYEDEVVQRNKSLEHLRQTSQVSSIYQGVKRIQRNINPRGEIYLITTDEKILELVKGELKGIKSQAFYFEPEFKNPDQAINTAPKRLHRWLIDAKQDTITTYERLAGDCQATVENIKKILRKKSNRILEIAKERNIAILDSKKGVEYLIEANIGDKIGLNEFEEKFETKWSNFIRSGSGRILINMREIKCKDGIISINK